MIDDSAETIYSGVSKISKYYYYFGLQSKNLYYFLDYNPKISYFFWIKQEKALTLSEHFDRTIMNIQRTLNSKIVSHLNRGKAIILIGARQVGKSTLFETINNEQNLNAQILNCDAPEVRQLLESPSTTEIDLLIGNSKTLIIDEAQRIPDIGLTLKRMLERHPETQLLVTGSSSLDICQKINEPLTGRKYEYKLYPISTQEIINSKDGLLWLKQLFDFRLIYGSYPEILTHPQEAKELLTYLSDSYLYKDILMLENIKKPQLLSKLLIAISLQIGSEVSYSELAQTVGTDSKTVEKYIDLLEKCFVIFRLGSLSRNLRNELKKSKKIYFYDNGIRNAILQNFAPKELRADNGALWENFFISERIKYNNNNGIRVNCYFWRTSSQQEIDFVEEKDGQFTLFEIKWNPKTKASFPKSFMEAYPVGKAVVVTPENYIDYLV